MAGTRLFISGEIAYASDVNTFLMDQVIARFADATERGLAFGDGIAIGNGGDGKPILSAGQFCYLIDRGDGFGEVQYWDGNSWESASQFAIADGQIITAKIAAGAVTSTKIAANSIDSSHIAAGTVIASDLDDLAVTTAKINDLAVTTGKIADLNVTTGKIADTAVTAAKIASAVAGNGLSGGAGTALAVNVDDSTVEINTDALRVKDAGITSAKLGSDLSFTGTTKIEEIFEKATVNTTTHPSTGSPLTLNISDGAVYYYTTPCPHNFTLDITATGMITGQALTLVFMMTSSLITGKVSLIKVNNTTPASVKWFGGNQYPNGSGGNAVDVYTITIFNNAGAFTVFASQSKFA